MAAASSQLDAPHTRAGYRPDIDGLRATAVVVVVLFHLGLSRFEGGFVGVDVFFVISGYLITALILKRVDSPGGFRFSGFYLRRIRRLVPPLIATVAATAVVASFLLVPNDMIALARSAVAALASVSNFVFFGEAGYWDTSADLKPLLHTWSLGVEEQFYMFWPALIVLLARLRSKKVPFGASVSAVAVLGLVIAVWMNSLSPTAAFYLFPFRVFQFAVGALVGWIPVRVLGKVMSSPGTRDAILLAGLALVVYPVLVYTDATPFPGWYAVPPTMGAALLLASGATSSGQGPIGGVLLENPVSVWLGKVSYSMYLVHWPVIVFYRYATGLDLNPAEQVGLAVATLLATVLLHYGVERRFYSRGMGDTRVVPWLSPGRFALRTASASAFVAVIMVHPWVSGGWAWRFPDLSLTPQQIEEGMAARLRLVSQGCSLRRLEPEHCDWGRDVQVLVLGNSHEPDGFNFLMGGYGSDPSVNLIAFGTVNQCENLRFEDSRWINDGADCERRLDALFDLPVTLDAVVYAANRPFDPNKDKLFAFVKGVVSANPESRLITYGGYINTDVSCARLLNETRSTRACIDPEHVTYFEADPTTMSFYDEVMDASTVYIDRVGLLCDHRLLAQCTSQSTSGAPMFYDSHHASLEFSLESGALYAQDNPGLLNPGAVAAGS